MRLCLLALFLAPAALGQETASGRIAGVVVASETDTVLPSASVLLLGTPARVATDADGRFVIEDVPVGTHRVRVSFVGYEPLDAEVTVRPGGTSWLWAELADDTRVSCIVYIVHGFEHMSRGIYGARVASYHVQRGPHDPWGDASCEAWEAPDPSPLFHARTR